MADTPGQGERKWILGEGGRRREGKENPYFPALIKILECDKLLKSLA